MILTTGDTVICHGSWGDGQPEATKVLRIELVKGTRKAGRSIQSIPWEKTKSRNVVVDLDNGHWAYGYQLRPVTSLHI